MDPLIGGALINAGSSLIGNLLGPSPQGIGDQVREQINAKMKMAEKWGISRLVMLGAPASVAPPQQVGGIGDTIASMGADIGRAVASQQTQPERLVQGLLLKKAGLENELLESQIRSINLRTMREAAPPRPVVVDPRTGLIPEKVTQAQRVPGVNMFGVPIEANPNFSDAGTATQRWGESELMETLLNLVIGGGDAYWNSNLRKAMNEPRDYSKGSAVKQFGQKYFPSLPWGAMF